MRELPKILNILKKDTKYDILVSDKDNGGDHDETDPNLFAEETQPGKIEQIGDSLERLKIIDFESFRLILTDALKSLRGLTDETICRI